ncbi:MAG: hypothetical protein ACRDD8_09810 [Bacteroidales bacterium]
MNSSTTQPTNQDILNKIAELIDAVEENNKLLIKLLDELDTNNHDTSDIKNVIIAGSTPAATLKQIGVNLAADILGNALFKK